MGAGAISDVDPDIQSSLEDLLSNDPEFADAAPAEKPKAKLRPAPAVEDDEDEEPRRPAAAKDEDEEPEEEAEAEAEEAGDEDKAKGEDDGDGDEEPSIETVGQLAEAFGVEEQELRGALRVDLGEERGQATLDELVSRYNEAPDTARIEEAVSTYEQETQQVRQQWGERVRDLTAKANGLMGLIEADDQSIARAREQGDSERVLQLIDEQQKRRGALQEAIGAMRQQEQEWQQQQEREEQRYRQREQERLQQKMPALRDPAKAKAAMEGIQKSLMAAGFTQEEVQNLVDHRAIIVANKAAEYDRLMAKVRASKSKKALRLPRVLKRSARDEKSGERAAKKRGQDKYKRLRQTGSEEDAAAVLLDRLD